MESWAKDWEQPLISVIVPVYCIEPYVEAAIQSVRAQTYDNWELICVVDGSPDGSSAICMAYAALDQRIMVVHTQNGGAGAARNRGIAVARGTYLLFLDGDDMLVPDGLSTCVLAALANSADVVQFEARVLVQDGKTHKANWYVRSRSYDGVWNGADIYLRQMRDGCYFPSPGLYLTCAGFYTEHGVRFPEGVIHEDEYGTYAMLMRAQRAVCLREQLYVRRYRPSSIMTKRDWCSSTRGCFVAYALVYGEEECASGIRADARELYLEAQLRYCIRTFYRSGLPLREFETAVCARQNEREALRSLQSSRELNPRWFAVLRTAFLVKIRMQETKAYVEKLLGSSTIARQQNEGEQDAHEEAVFV